MRVALRVMGLVLSASAALWLASGCKESPEPQEAAHPTPPAATLPATQTARPAAPGPEILLPDIRILEPSSFYLVDQRSAGDRRLKFTTTIWNAGPGPIEVRGHADPTTGELAVQQVLHVEGGGTVGADFVGTFQFEHRHGHLHLAGFARYELWSVGTDGELVQLVAKNEKVGFCLMDNVVVDEALTTQNGEPVYPIDCEADVQGISPGYGDVYVAQLYEQDVVIDGLPDGRYALVNIANPNGDIAEADYDNNTQTTYLTLSGRRVIPD